MDKKTKDELLWQIEMLRTYQSKATRYQTKADVHYDSAQFDYYRANVVHFTELANAKFHAISDIIDKL